MLTARIHVLALIVLVPLAACSGESQPTAAASADPVADAAGPGARDPHAGLAMPPSAGAGEDPHAGLARPDPVPASFSGTIVLAGELAAEEGGVLMVSACPEGSRLPLMSYLIPLESAPPAEGGRRVVPFRLDGSNDLMGGGGLPHDSEGMQLELSVRFDADGKVETSEGDVTVAVPVQPDATAVEVVLGQ
jgi:hypothetical protein